MRGDKCALGGFTTPLFKLICESPEMDMYSDVATFVKNALVKPQSENSAGLLFF